MDHYRQRQAKTEGFAMSFMGFTINGCPTAKLSIRLVVSATSLYGGREKGAEFHQDNNRTHTSIVTCQQLREFDWVVFMHPLYSPDQAPCGYYLFLSVSNDFAGEKFL